MKKIKILAMSLLVAMTMVACSGDDAPSITADSRFITEWKTDNTGESDDNQVKLSLDENGTYDFTVDWGDGSTVETITAFNQSEVTHTYSTAGTYTVIIDGQIEGFGFTEKGSHDSKKLIDIKNWGSVKLHNNDGQLSSTSLTTLTATDEPNLSSLTNFCGMFLGSTSFNGDISAWDVSNITNMQDMFYQVTSFNQNLSGWDVSNVVNISGMFSGATSFNQNLSG